MFPRKIILFFVQLFPILVDSLVIQIPSETVFGPQNPTQGQFQNVFGNVGFIQFIRIVCCTRNSSFPVVMKPYITYGCLEACFFSQIFFGMDYSHQPAIYFWLFRVPGPSSIFLPRLRFRILRHTCRSAASQRSDLGGTWGNGGSTHIYPCWHGQTRIEMTCFLQPEEKWIWEWYVIFKIIGYSTL